MKYATVAAQVLLGLLFFVFGLDYFLHFLALTGEPPKGLAADFAGALGGSGYMDVVKALEVIGGALLLSWRFAPLGLVVLGPIVVNIVLFDIFLAKAFNPLGAAAAALFLFLLYVHRRSFAGLFAKPVV